MFALDLAQIATNAMGISTDPSIKGVQDAIHTHREPRDQCRDAGPMKYSVRRRSEVQGVMLMQDGAWTTHGFGTDPSLGKTLIRRFTEQMVGKSHDGEPVIMVKGPALYKIGQELNVTFKSMRD